MQILNFTFLKKMSRDREYLENITNIPEFIPDLGNIVSNYTGGRCDPITDEGKTCWTNHEDCGSYCLNNLWSWLKPKFFTLLGKPLIDDQDSEEVQRLDQTTQTLTILDFPYISYKKWQAELRLDIDHPEFGEFFITFVIETRTGMVDDQSYSKRLTFKHSPKIHPDLVTFISEQNADPISIEYGNDKDWENLQNYMNNVYVQFENLLYSNNESPLYLQATFSLPIYQIPNLNSLKVYYFNSTNLKQDKFLFAYLPYFNYGEIVPIFHRGSNASNGYFEFAASTALVYQKS